MSEWRTVDEETITEETAEEAPPVGVQAQVVLNYLEELHGAIIMLSSNLSNQIKSLREVIESHDKEPQAND